jgi:hypothetical protein
VPPRRQAEPTTPTITPGEQRIELQLEGFRSVVSGGFLAISKSNAHIEKKLDRANETLVRIAEALELQNRLLAQRNNGHVVADERTAT